MSFFYNMMTGVLTACLGVALPTLSEAQKRPSEASLLAPVVTEPLPWVPFQVDEHLAVQLPSPAHVLSLPPEGTYPAQGYFAPAATGAFIIVRLQIPREALAGLAELGQDRFFTTITQGALTSMQATRVNQTRFKVGKFEGLNVGFRLNAPTGDGTTQGQLWALRVRQSVYLLQSLTNDSSSTAHAAQQARFIASLDINDAPYTAPDVAAIAKFRTGRFQYLESSLKSVTVERSDTTQIEVHAAKDLRIVYGVRWNADGYDLTQRSSTSSIGPQLQGKTLHVRITGVEGNVYAYQATLLGMVLTGKIRKLK
ncbi:hypothetical protein MUN81_07780 [Hymenobacter sp. 5317J-9]|uniref:hypothetical protein n=1 Tax=Hymenobacter sp. 5317J-9 TaxID=2932250 RepID=UPI001FD69ABC|nr:hypothetical protein [Hymenobacter sp. 5317J-9]UOQ99387.1 hypothetical protein MUN81_07780 [Hymenobacter sp. 5317J-9]